MRKAFGFIRLTRRFALPMTNEGGLWRNALRPYLADIFLFLTCQPDLLCTPNLLEIFILEESRYND